MFKSKFLDIASTFSKAEQKQFREFLNSPFHNTNKNVIKLFENIRKSSPDFKPELLDKEKLYRKIYEGKKYNDTVMRILLSDLLSLAEEYLAYRRFLKSRINTKIYLLEELKERKLDSLFNKNIKEAENLLRGDAGINDTYFLNYYDIETVKVNFLIVNDRQDESGLHLLKKGEFLAAYFLINLLNVAQELTEHEEVLNEKYEFNIAGEFLKNIDIEKLMAYLKKNNYEYYHILEIYYYMNKCSGREADDSYYPLLKEAIEKNLNLFRKDEHYNLFLIMESCCITNMRHEGGRGYKDLMDVYELMLTNRIFSNQKNEFMQANVFRNIFYTSVVLKRYEWAEKFVNDYHNFLLPEQRLDMYNYTNAVLNFEKKNFSAALEQISKVNYRFFVFKFEAKTLMIKLFYELDSFEQAESMIDSFSHFLSKNKIVSGIYKRQFMNFLKYCRILIRNSRNGRMIDRLDIAELKKQVSNSEYVINKNWLLEKVNALELL